MVEVCWRRRRNFPIKFRGFISRKRRDSRNEVCVRFIHKDRVRFRRVFLVFFDVIATFRKERNNEPLGYGIRSIVGCIVSHCGKRGKKMRTIRFCCTHLFIVEKWFRIFWSLFLTNPWSLLSTIDRALLDVFSHLNLLCGGTLRMRELCYLTWFGMITSNVGHVSHCWIKLMKENLAHFLRSRITIVKIRKSVLEYIIQSKDILLLCRTHSVVLRCRRTDETLKTLT